MSGPAVTFQIDPTTAARSGFTVEEVSTDAAALLGGEPAATPVVLNDRAYPIRVRFPERIRTSLEQMTNTLLASSTNRTATLGSLATLTTDPGETEIRRENLQRLVEVTARLENVGLGKGIAEVLYKKADAKQALESSVSEANHEIELEG